MITRKGFTLIELIVAISVIAVILLIAIPQYSLYKSNLLLKKESKLLECFIKDVRTTAKSQCVDIDIYDIDTYGVTMDTPLPLTGPGMAGQEGFPQNWIAENWITPAYADRPKPPNSTRCTGLKAKSIRINYLKLYQPHEGIELSSTYNIASILTVTPNGYRDNGGMLLSGLTYTVESKSTPKILYVTINDAGISQVTENPPMAPGGSGDD